MDWSLYLYMLPIVFLALALLFAASRLGPRLGAPAPRPTGVERAMLACALVLGIFAVYGNFFLGSQSFAYHDVGSDTAAQYVPYYINLINSVKNGSLGLWSFDYGLGTSFMSYQSWTLDPFNLVIVPLGLLLGTQALSKILVFAQALKILSCGFLFDEVLAYYCERPAARILGAGLFAFCGYLAMWGQHYWLGTVIVMAALMTLFIEKLLSRWTALRYLGLMATTALSVMMSTYSGFMVMLYAAAYAALRTVYVKGCTEPAPFFKAFLPLALPVVCGLMVSCLTVAPYATLLLGESSRVSGGSGGTGVLGYLASFVPLRWIPAILSRFMGTGLIATMSDIPAELIPPTQDFDYVNVYEFIQLGFGAAAFVLLGQFAHWAFKDADKRAKTLVCIAATLCLLYCFNNFLPALSNVFVAPKYRSVFALAFPICIALALGFEKRVLAGAPARAPLAACTALSLGVLAYSLANAQDGRLESVAYLLVVAALAALLFAWPKLGQLRVAVPLVLALALGSSVFDAFMVSNNRAWASPQNLAEAQENALASETKEALTWIAGQDSGYYRVEKLYIDWTRLNDALIEDYHGVASYNSTLDSDVVEFYRRLWPNMLVGDSAYQEFINDPDHPALLKMLGVKYLLAHDELNFDWCSQVNQFGNVRVYRLSGVEGVANVTTGAIAESDAQNIDAASQEAMLAASTVVPDSVYAELESGSDDAAMPGPVITGGAEEGLDLSGYTVASNSASLSASGEVSGKLTALTSNSVACVAIPHTAGWKVYVDGQEVETYRANYGFIGFTLSAGEHSFAMRYEAPNAKLGITLAVCGAAAGAAICAYTAFKNKNMVQE